MSPPPARPTTVPSPADPARPATVVVDDRVRSARAEGRPVVALESTIFSDLGLPSPANRQALDRVVAAVEAGGAVPALTAVIDGRLRVGVGPADYDLICGPTDKVAARDVGPAVAQGLAYGATTVSAGVLLAAAAGIEVFSTGGIGGVHRGWASSGDISADLPTIARHQVVTVSAGAKVFLDLPATLEYLETLSVPVIGWRCDEFPAFHAPTSGLPVPARADDAAEVAAIARSHWAMGGGGLVVVAPVPADEGIPYGELTELVDHALRVTDTLEIVGAGVTPAVLAQMAELSDGRTIGANLALAEHNATVASAIAAALSVDGVAGDHGSAAPQPDVFGAT